MGREGMMGGIDEGDEDQKKRRKKRNIGIRDRDLKRIVFEY